ncbi:T9SS type A sorting domain-containing protein, partial [Schleiferiaceae bacterium]|nr:T9SS type A sorting domain-containing protein [Schleiferiaceae bacterium]
HVVGVLFGYPTTNLSPDSLKIYIDGQLVVQSNVTSVAGYIPSNPNFPFWFGSLPGSATSFFDGQIDDIAIYNRALSASEIQSLYSANSSNLSYNWSTGDTTASITANPTQTTTYYCTVSDGISTCTDSVTVYVNSPVVDLGADTLSVCGQDSVLLDAGAGHSSYLWNTGETTQTIYADASGSYSVEVSDGTPSSNSSSLSFDGNGNKIQVSANPVLNTNDLTLSCWVKLKSYGPYNHFINKTSSNDIQFVFANNATGLYAYINNDFYQSASLPDLNSWNYLTLTFSSSTKQGNIYINDSLVFSFLTTSTIIQSTYDLFLGGYWNATYNTVDGEMDNIQIWNTALTQSEIQQYMSCPPTGNEAGLVGYWNFEEGSGSVANDLSGNGNHGTINGASWSSDVPSQSCGLGCTATDSVYVSLVKATITASDSIVCAGDSVNLINEIRWSSLPRYLPSHTPVAYFDFTNGSTNDVSDNGSSLQNFGGQFISDENGIANNAIRFDGVSEYAQITLSENLENDFTIFLRIHNPPNSDATYDRIIGFENYNLDLAKGGSNLNLYTPNCGWNPLTGTLSHTNWHDFVLTKKGSVLYVFVDEVLTDSLICSSSYFGDELFLGRPIPSNGEYSHYTVSELVFYNQGIRTLNYSNASNLTYNWSTGDTTASITANPTQTTNYYCTVSDGITSCTDSIEIKVGLMDNPADVTVDLAITDTASFSVNYLDSSTSYQWEIKSVVSWLPLLDSSSFYVGGKSHLLKLRNIGTNFNGLEFRCIVTSPSCSEVSDPAVLTVIGAGAMVSNPISLNEAVSQFIGENNLTPLELPVSIRPNPTTGIFYVHPFIEGTYSLIDSKGRTVESGRATPSYDLSSYPNGVYILRLTLETSTHQIRVIKQ